MTRALGLAVVLALAGATAALADEAEPTATKVAGAAKAGASREPRAILTTAFAEQRAAVDRTATVVDDKVRAAAQTRAARARAAYAALRADASGTAIADGGLAIARRRAAVKWLLARDRAELGLLADEAAQLAAARTRIDRDAERAATIALPSGLVWPVAGTIARAYGPFEHVRSGATLTRRGLDLEVEAGADVVAPAAGTVRYAGPVRGLDTGVIVDHGDFLSVIAKLDPAVAVAVGDTVAQGAVLGRAARRRIYLELRVEVGAGGTPIDPATVLPAP
jgi:murein hydrolase activator